MDDCEEIESVSEHSRNCIESEKKNIAKLFIFYTRCEQSFFESFAIQFRKLSEAKFQYLFSSNEYKGEFRDNAIGEAR